MLSGHYHTMAPGNNLAVWHFFKYTKGHIPLYVLPYLLQPMQGDSRRGVADPRISIRIYMDLHGWARPDISCNSWYEQVLKAEALK